MRPQLVIVILAVALVAFGWMMLVSDSGDDADVTESLLRRESLRESNQAVSSKPFELADDDWTAMELKGMGLGVPGDLQVGPLGPHWKVNRDGDSSVAVVPFHPDRYREISLDQSPRKENPGFLGADACAECHGTKTESFSHTGHARTSRLATPTEVSGPSDDENNVLKTRRDEVSFKMVERNGRCYQQTRFFGWLFEIPMDFVIGSSKLGESYAYWHRDELYQSVVTYLEADDCWINSPGYTDGDAAFTRPILARCASCHFTYMDFRSPPNRYSPASVILGVSCERCHGPGKDHVVHHQKNKAEKEAKFIAMPSDLPREQQLQLCGQCHSPATPTTTDPFAFRPGDDLADHFVPSLPEDETGGVHASNQTNRLKLSRCFQQSEMVCQTCHDPHQHERGDQVLFSKRCLNCHQEQQCRVDVGEIGSLELSDNCIDCHMPSRSSEHLSLSTSSGKVFPPLRDHHIRVDAQASKEFLDKLSPSD